MNERTVPGRLLLRAAAVGATAGAIGATFRAVLLQVQAWRVSLEGSARFGLAVAACAAAVTAAVALVRRFAPETRGSGIPEIEAALDEHLALRWWRVLPVKFGSGLLAIGAGLVLGREGPTIQMGGATGAALASRLGLAERNLLIASGAGAGLAAAFNAPLAGILFVVEEMRGHFRYHVLSLHAVIVACVSSDVVVRAMLGSAVTVPVPAMPAPPLSAVWVFVVQGAVFGAVGAGFNRALLATVAAAGRLPGWWWIAAAAGAGVMAGLLGGVLPGAVGDGEQLIHEVVGGNLAVSALLGLFVMRLATTLLSYGSGAPGGIFAPMLALATVLSLWLGHFAHRWVPGQIGHPALLAVAGMGAMFAASVRAPLTGIALTLEITGRFDLVLPLTVTCVSAAIVAEALRGRPIYAELGHLAGYSETRSRARRC